MMAPSTTAHPHMPSSKSISAWKDKTLAKGLWQMVDIQRKELNYNLDEMILDPGWLRVEDDAEVIAKDLEQIQDSYRGIFTALMNTLMADQMPTVSSLEWGSRGEERFGKLGSTERKEEEERFEVDAIFLPLTCYQFLSHADDVESTTSPSPHETAQFKSSVRNSSVSLSHAENGNIEQYSSGDSVKFETEEEEEMEIERPSFIRNGVVRLPPGFRFHPTDEELVAQYLKRKAFSCPLPAAVIPEINLSEFDPWDLPERSMYRRSNRAAGSGYWKATEKPRPVVAPASKELVGMKRVLVFHRWKSPRGSRRGLRRGDDQRIRA
ncbi:hypothetical protein ZIOFF_037239 [Zingiber officinale]|uniref:NAC domain-containing protein n=1 Tax=Zingiber officinale TaxID=94328 RepID=A0A8J5GD03_ZINOF|nr:hypothetical protein ZIOFF_037239 [Zingiber officinale]